MAKLNIASDDARHFWCPGCNGAHGISIRPGSWTCNDDLERPTISPSVLLYSHGTLIDNTLDGDALTAPSNVRQTPRCHSFITDGRIQFLADSDHALAGQTVELPEWP